ncbi:CU044_5270 family protein [Streptomyces sp. NPDC001717]|uniref:CU044_5270 family protein n=1 Tax=Streptomyces sp. NPDC001717 TaxID=3364604 RepID=UPI00369268BB
MTDITTDFLDFPDADRLRKAGEVAVPAPRVVEAALLAVRAAAAAEDSAPVTVVAPRRTRTRRLLVSAAAIAAIVAGVSVYPVAGLKGSPPPATASAAGFLRQVAATEAKSPAADAPYREVHTVTRAWVTMGSPYTDPPQVYDERSWVGSDGLFRRNGDGEVFRTPLTQIRWLEVPGQFEGFTWEQVKALPEDPSALKALLAQSYRKTPGFEMFGDVFYRLGLEGLLQDAPLGPRQRAAVYEALADTPGLRLVGPVKDSEGRDGTAVEVDNARTRVRLTIDSRTGGLLEKTVTYVEGEYAGKIAGRVTVLSSGPAQSVPPYREQPSELTGLSSARPRVPLW